jgi:chromosome segregation ATPase
VKSPKKPSKEPPLPSQDESRRTNVLMEQMLSKFDAFGEAQSLLREDVNSLKPRFDKLEQKVDVLELAVRTNGKAISALKEAVQGNTEAIHTLQADVAEIKDDLKSYNQRVDAVEAKLAS